MSREERIIQELDAQVRWLIMQRDWAIRDKHTAQKDAERWKNEADTLRERLRKEGGGV